MQSLFSAKRSIRTFGGLERESGLLLTFKQRAVNVASAACQHPPLCLPAPFINNQNTPGWQQTVEKGPSAALRSTASLRRTPKYACVRRFLARLASGTFLTGLKTGFFYTLARTERRMLRLPDINEVESFT